MNNKELISYNPATINEKVGLVAMSSQSDVSVAVQKARVAFLEWQSLSVEERCSYYKKLISIFQNKIETIAHLQSQEMGKPITQSIGEVKETIGLIEFCVRAALELLKGDVVDESKEQRNTVYFEPYGVAAIILPWNFPSLMYFESTTQAVLAGNTVIVKHSEECPLTSKALQEVFDEAGFPEGVIQTLYGDGAIGAMLVDEDIDLIHFTGSSKVGKTLYKRAAEKFIPAVLEMGGSSPGIIFEDADIDKICDCVVRERFDNCGQVCCALKRLFVHEDCFDEVVKKIVQSVKDIKIGDPMDQGTTLGPLVAQRQLALLQDQLQDAIDKGAHIAFQANIPSNLKGAYFGPTVLTNVTKGMRVYKEETFGPVLPIMSFKEDDEAINMANDTNYGLSAFVYTEDMGKANYVSSLLQAGNVAVNDTSYFSDNSPFGGYKESGIGRGRGKYGFMYVTQLKTVACPNKKEA